MAKSRKLVGIFCSSQWIMGFFSPQDVSEACLQCAECTEAEAAEVIEGLQLTGSWVSWQNPSFWETARGLSSAWKCDRITGFFGSVG